MPDGTEGSVTAWIGDLKGGGSASAQQLWERYFERLVHLARAKLRSTHRHGAAEDEEDAALSAFDSFCRGAARGCFPRLSDRNDLWRLLVVLTVRKVLDQLERQGAARRGGGKLIAGSDGPAGGESTENYLDRLAGSEPTPEFAAMVAEQYQRLREDLGDDSLRQVLDLRLEGCSREDIAERLGCAVRTVTRKLDVIRRTWLGERL